jgi:class 3 adenylate cyclase
MEHTAAILFSDIKGSSYFSEAQALLFKRNVEPHILREVAKSVSNNRFSNNLLHLEHGPILYYNTWGDSYLFVFRNPKDALKAALALRDGFRDFDFTGSGLPGDIHIRCSIHAGVIAIDQFDDPIRGGKSRDVVGQNIVISARIEPITPPGRIWVTEAFKLLLRELPRGIVLDSLGVKQLSKTWGASTLYDLRRDSEQSYHDNETLLHENIDETYLPISLARAGAIYTIGISSDPVSCQRPMGRDAWGAKTREMSEFLCRKDRDKTIENIGVAIGVQNFIFDGSRLYAGVRTKAAVDGWGTGFTLGKGSFNTGYKLIRSRQDFKEYLLESQQDLFNIISGRNSIQKRYVSQGDDVDKIVIEKAGNNRCIIEVNGKSFVSLVFINTSRIFPRLEIGICKYMDISNIQFDGMIPSFGKDAYAEGVEEGNYWLWINDGVIYARSIATEKYIPCIAERENARDKKAIFILNDIERYGFRAYPQIGRAFRQAMKEQARCTKAK